MYINSNLSPKESLRVYGSLPEDHILDLIEDSEKLEKLEDSILSLQDAKAGYPEEDFLEPILDLLNELHNGLRKSATKEALKNIIEQVEDLQLEQARSAEYGLDIINKVLEAV